MNIYDILFQTVSNLTGGLIVDVQTAMVGVVTILCVLMGLDLLKDVLLSALSERRRVRDYDKIVESAALTGRSEDDVYGDVSERMYQKRLSSYQKKYD